MTAQPPLRRRGFKPILLSLGIGAIGGALLSALHVPLAWMLGPLLFNIFASLRGWPVLIPHGARVFVLAVIGLSLGGTFAPELLARIGELALSLSMMVVFVPLVTFAASEYFRRAAGFDRATAVFSGAPGSLSAMVVVGGGSGADERLITLAQGLRVVIVVAFMPLVVSATLATAPHLATVLPVGGPFTWADAGFLLGAAGAGLLVARLLGTMVAAMTGAMIASAALYLGGVITYRLPEELLWVALWILGSAIGSRFSTVTPGTLMRVSRHAVVATAIVIAVSAVFAYVASLLTGTGYLTALLSFTPGGVAEMCLIAMAFDVDPAVVAVHHVVRIAILVTAAPVAAKLLLPGGAAVPDA